MHVKTEKKNLNQNKKIIVGLSGGVDSAVSSYLLKKKKLLVEAVFMRNWDDFVFGNFKLKSSKCSQVQDWKDAKEVSDYLGINLTKVVFIKEYWKEVFLDFIDGMKKGLTPNPDILCNKNIKFSHFFNNARNEMDASYVATGHYAGIRYDSDKKTHYLVKSKDQEKDQTYFLCLIDRKVLPYLIFPLSELKKKEVRQIAEDAKIPNSKKKDSTGICFIGEDNFSSFIGNFLEKKIGDIIDISSMKKVGTHEGYYFFTIGQRKSASLSGSKSPFYVVSKDIENNNIYVSSEPNNFLYSSWCVVENFNWLVPQEEIKKFSDLPITVKFRHRQKESIAKFSFLTDNFSSVKIFLQEPTRAITPGQFAVIYSMDICLGGGVVLSTEKLDSKCNLKELN